MKGQFEAADTERYHWYCPVEKTIDTEILFRKVRDYGCANKWRFECDPCPKCGSNKTCEGSVRYRTEVKVKMMGGE